MKIEGEIAGYKKKTLFITAVIIILAGMFFYAGAKYEKHKLSSLDLLKDNSNSSSMKVQYIIGTITTKNTQGLTLKIANGSSQIITFSATTRISKKNKRMTLANLKIGDQVKVKVFNNSNNNFTALVVRRIKSATINHTTTTTTTAPATSTTNTIKSSSTKLTK